MISVVVVYNDKQILDKWLLKSLKNQTVNFELIALDNTKAEFKSAAEVLNYGGKKAKGKYVIRVCRGTACHVKGGQSILRVMKKELGLDEGETSPDYQFTLETVACLGTCFLAPTMMVNRTYFGKLSPPKVTSVLNQYGKDKGEDE